MTTVQAMSDPINSTHISYNIVMYLQALYKVSIVKQRKEIAKLVGQQVWDAHGTSWNDLHWDGRISEALVRGMAYDVLFNPKPMRQIKRNLLGKTLMEIDWDNLPPEGTFQVSQSSDKRYQHFARALYMFLQFSYVTEEEHKIEMAYRSQLPPEDYHDNMSGIRYYHLEDLQLLDALFKEEGQGYVEIAQDLIVNMIPVASVKMGSLPDLTNLGENPEF